MKIKYHEGIYYPESKEELDKLTKIEKKGEAKAIIVPHQVLSLSHLLISEGLAYAGEPNRIIIISPLHKGRVREDSAYSLFEGEILPSSSMFSLGLKKSEYYAEEEAGAELLLPFIERNFPSVSFAIIYADIITAKESKALSELIKKEDHDNTLFIISSNITQKCSNHEEMMNNSKINLDAILNQKQLLDSVNKGRIKFCGATIVDSINRALGGKWKLVMEEEGDVETKHASLILKA